MKWQFQQAKRQFSKVILAAMEQGPQTITRRGKAAAVVVSSEEHHRLARRRERGGLLEFFLEKRAALRSLTNQPPVE